MEKENELKPISPNELRIGNWVCTTNQVMVKVFSINSPKPLKKSSLSDKWIIELFDNGLFDSSIDDISPIPLTEEWLIKFGWKQIDKYTFTKKGWFIYKRKRGFVTGSKKRELKLESVHQLQNLYFALSGEELEPQK